MNWQAILYRQGSEAHRKGKLFSTRLFIYSQDAEAAKISDTQPDEDTLHRCAALLADEKLPDGWQMDTGSGYTHVAHHAKWQLYYREFPARSPAERFKAWFKGSDASRAWDNNQNLLWSGFSAPPTVARGKLPDNTEYIFTGTAKGERLSEWIKPAHSNNVWSTATQRRKLLRELGIFVGRLHCTGFIHGNLQTLNILVYQGPSRFEFSLINNEHNTQIQPVPGKSLLQNLTQLNLHPSYEISRSDRLHFFTAWHSQMRDLSDLEAKLLARRSYEWAMQRLGQTKARKATS